MVERTRRVASFTGERKTRKGKVLKETNADPAIAPYCMTAIGPCKREMIYHETLESAVVHAETYKGLAQSVEIAFGKDHKLVQTMDMHGDWKVEGESV